MKTVRPRDSPCGGAHNMSKFVSFFMRPEHDPKKLPKFWMEII